ncbi:MAG: hypothetical protein KC503_18085 [Myxococcales bacterium]|nr:hypothetical protein [Myxococcales bacterium]
MAIGLCMLSGCPDESTPVLPDSIFFPDVSPGPPPVDGRVPKAFAFPNEATQCSGNDYLDAATLELLRGGLIGPGGRVGFSAVWEPCYERVVLFGGQERENRCGLDQDEVYRNDTWVWVDGFNNWLKLLPDTSPPARSHHASAFDRSRKRVYIFGGRSRTKPSGDYTLLDDLWAFDVNTDTWSPLTTSGDKPTARAGARMAYDYKNDRVILLGGNTAPGQNAAGASDELYTLNLETLAWTRQTVAAPKPSARFEHTSAVDVGIGTGRLYVFGGTDNAGALLGDLWALDLSNLTWSEVWKVGQSNGPTARAGAAIAEDVAGKRIVLIGGRDTVGPHNDVWWFDIDRAAWAQNKPGDTLDPAKQCSDPCLPAPPVSSDAGPSDASAIDAAGDAAAVDASAADASTADAAAPNLFCAGDLYAIDETSGERRWGGELLSVFGYDYLLLHGGQTRCGFLNDTWRIVPGNDPNAGRGDPKADPPKPPDPQVWNVRITARQGLTCARRNPTISCTRLCPN